jgi:hypothetical protein
LSKSDGTIPNWEDVDDVPATVVKATPYRFPIGTRCIVIGKWRSGTAPHQRYGIHVRGKFAVMYEGELKIEWPKRRRKT